MVWTSIPPLIEGPVRFSLNLSFPAVFFKRKSSIKSNECVLLSFKWWGNDTDSAISYVSPDTLMLDEDKLNNYGQFSNELHFDVRSSAVALKRYFDDMNGLEIVVTAKQNKSNAQRKLGTVIIDDLSNLIDNVDEEVVSEYPITLADATVGGSIQVKAKLEETISDTDKENAMVNRYYNSSFISDDMRIERIDRILFEIDKELQSGIMDFDEFSGNHEPVLDHSYHAEPQRKTAPNIKDQKKSIAVNAFVKNVLTLTLRNVKLEESHTVVSSVFCKVYTFDTSKSFTFAYGSDAVQDMEVSMDEKWIDSNILLYFDFLDADGNSIAQGVSDLPASLTYSGELVIMDVKTVIATCSCKTSLKQKGLKRKDNQASKFNLRSIDLSNNAFIEEPRFVIKGSKTTKTVFQHSSLVTVNLPFIIEVWDRKNVLTGIAEINEDLKNGSVIPLFNPLRSMDHNGPSIVINSKRDASPAKKHEKEKIISSSEKNSPVKETIPSPKKSQQGRHEGFYLAINVEAIKLSDSKEPPHDCEVSWQDAKMKLDLTSKKEQRFSVATIDDFKNVENNELLFQFSCRNTDVLYATIDLNPLCAGLIQINGWYRLKDGNNHICGSVHIKIKPSQQLSARKHGITLLTSGAYSEGECKDELQELNEQLNRSLRKPSPIEKLQESLRRSIAKDQITMHEEQDGQLYLEDLEETGQKIQKETSKEPAFGGLTSGTVLKYDVGWDFTKNITETQKDEA